MNRGKQTKYEFGEFSFETERRRIERGETGEVLQLPPKAYHVLQMLVENAGDVVDKEMLMQTVWADTFVEESNLTQMVYLLRKALGENAAGQLYIQTVPKRGYCFVGDFKTVERSDEQPSQSKKIAVLPFENRSDHAENDYLAEGLSENLIDAFSQIPQLKVIARNSAFKYKNLRHDTKEIAVALDVKFILDGRIVQRGEKTTIRAELIEAEHETQLWGTTIECRVCDLQEIKSEIARNVLKKLDLDLTRTQEKLIDRPFTFNDEAYQLYLKGLFLFRQGGLENAVEALRLYDIATGLDPDFAFVHALKPAIYSFLAEGFMDKAKAFEKAKTAAAEAMRTGKDLPQTHTAAAIIKKWELDLAGTERDYCYALELNPNNSALHNNYALVLSARGDHRRALVEIERAAQLDPLLAYIDINKAWILTNAGRFDEALEILQDQLGRQPELKLIYSFIAMAYEGRGMYREAIAASRELLDQEAFLIYAQADIIYNLYRLGEHEEAQLMLREIAGAGRKIPPTKLAPIYLVEGKRDAALETLEEAYRERDPELHALRVDFRLESLHEEPRLRQIMKKIGLI